MTENVIWWNNGNKPMDPAAFDRLHDDFLLALADKDQLYVADLYGGSQPEHRVRVRVVNELAWHNLFIRTLLVRPEASMNCPGSSPNIRSSTCRASVPTRSGTAAAARRWSRSISRRS